MQQTNITTFIQKYISQESLGGVILFTATLLALLVANSFLGQAYYDLWHMPLGITLGEHTISMTLTYWIDDGLMALFFLMIGLEIKRELLFGELSTRSKASLPLIAAIGGMVVPALFYFAFNSSGDVSNGFGIPMATDIAFALGILMLLGKRVPLQLKIFLVSLAVVDDLGAVMIIALFYTAEFQAIYLLAAAGVMAILFILNYMGVKRLLPYLLLGIPLWIFIHDSGMHATIAGILLAITIPSRSRIMDTHFVDKVKNSLDLFNKHKGKDLLTHKQHYAIHQVTDSCDNVQSPMVKLEHYLHPLNSYFIMPLFAFSNAGVVLTGGFGEYPTIALGIFMGLLIGKPIGVFGFVWLATKLKIAELPEGMNFGQVLSAGFLAGIGFTMSIFIAHLAFSNEAMIDSAKISVLGTSFIAAIIGILLILKYTKPIRD
ncbi:MAG: Na+/H+ antiporter NhaA type [uncultured Sulfurovum sp.]|uniref:Na(+)/H(+) antiporter NhaA n=1 Tax=uncultured Sulfurovum sp. TaxID=269237 RepID=A0A6S6TNA1_9BACT|nr:MAG: Na+/H+ antiporter NhaA type [uncultured Sulfurovum sp.]